MAFSMIKARGNWIFCNAALGNTKRIGRWANIVRCSGSRGRFTAVPLQFPEIVPSWLKHARDRMRAVRDMAEFRQVAENTHLDSAHWWKAVSTMSPENDDIWHMVVTSRHHSFAPAYVLEAFHFGFLPLHEDGMFGVPCGMALDDLAVKWSRMVGLRFAVSQRSRVSEAMQKLCSQSCSTQCIILWKRSYAAWEEASSTT